MSVRRISLAVIAAMQWSSIFATPLKSRQIDPQYSTFALCIRETIHGYPHSGEKPTLLQFEDCVERSKRIAKEVESLPEIDDFTIYARNKATPRGLLEEVFRAGKALFIEEKPFCLGKTVHDNFLWVTDIRDTAVEACQGLIEQLNENGFKDDGGLAQVVRNFTSGHDKQGHQLKDNRVVTATYLLTWYPPAHTAIETVKAVASGVEELCQYAVSKIATKDLGCTAEINYYRPSHAKSYTGTGAIGGIIDMFWGEGEDSVAKMTIDFSNDD